MSTSAVTDAVADILTIPAARDLPAGSRDTPEVRALIDTARAGSREAFGELVTMHERVLFRTALAVLGSREDAQDATQEAFIVAWRKLGGFRGDATFRTWLLTIVWRKALDRRRKRQAWWRGRQAPRAEADPLDALAAAAPDPERSAVARDEARRVAVEIGRLSPKLRDTLLLAASGEHSYDQIAALLAVPLGTVKWRVSEARRLLTASLKDRS
jgi:RNA polymerase sigma-70 factor, ECF subfamily